MRWRILANDLAVLAHRPDKASRKSSRTQTFVWWNPSSNRLKSGILLGPEHAGETNSVAKAGARQTTRMYRTPVLWVVRAVGLEPTLLAEPDFESGASTNFTTPAWRASYSGSLLPCKRGACDLLIDIRKRVEIGNRDRLVELVH